MRFVSKRFSVYTGIVFSLLSLFTSGSVIMLLYPQAYLSLVLPALIMFFITRERTCRTRNILLGLVGIALLSLTVNINAEYMLTTAKFIIAIVFAYQVAKLIAAKVLRQWFVNGIYLLSLLSIVVFALVNVFSWKPPLGVVTTPNGVSYYNGILFFVNSLQHQQFRNYGAFWEPGIFASYILIALALETIFQSEPSKLKILVLLFALYTTKSTAGYLLVVVIFLMVMVRRVKAKYQTVFSVLGVMLIVFAFAVQDRILDLLLVIDYKTFAELVVSNNKGSLLHRLSSPIQNLQVFLQNPLFGASLGGVGSLYAEIGRITQTSTTTYYLAAFGLGGVLYTILMARALLWNKTISLTHRLLFFALVLLIVNKEPHTFFTLTYILLFSMANEASKLSVGNNLEPNYA